MNWAAIARFITRNLPVVATIVVAVRDMVKKKQTKPADPPPEEEDDGDG
jgi:hypothetical protein